MDAAVEPAWAKPGPILTRIEQACRVADRFFKRTLACRIDRRPYWLWTWWYNWTARRAWFFHRRWCPRCRNR